MTNQPEINNLSLTDDEFEALVAAFKSLHESFGSEAAVSAVKEAVHVALGDRQGAEASAIVSSVAEAAR